MKVSEFHYDLPDGRIAQSAVEPRHDSRLLDTRDLTDHRFLDLPSLLEPGDLVVVNETRVRAARLKGRRIDTGGRVELLLLKRHADSWDALARPSRRLHPGVKIDCDGLVVTVQALPQGGLLRVTLDSQAEEEAVASVGEVPLPPYFNGLLETPERYQTIFAKRFGSAAAPTAGLHFTTDVLAGLSQRSISVAAVDLHVSLDTFRPMTVEDIGDHVMHSEWCSISEQTAESIMSTQQKGGRIVAVGTTVVRTLESFSDTTGGVSAGSGPTDLFIVPGIPIRAVDLLVTNFHMPSSTLLVMLAAFVGEAWREAYDVALERDYRFLSFGDSMIAQRADA